MTNNYFEITPDKNELAFEQSRNGEVTFTARNVSGLPMRGKARWLPTDQNDATWFSIVGESIRHFDPDATEVFELKIAVPDDATPGDHKFRFGVYNVANMAEQYGESAEITLKIPFKAPPPPPPPIWPWLVVAGVLLIGLLTFFLWPEDEPPIDSDLEAAFTVEASSVLVGKTVQFKDDSIGEPDRWAWDFGDDTTSTDQNPDHVFETTGTFNVILRVFAGSVTDKETLAVTVSEPATPPVASFNIRKPTRTALREGLFSGTLGTRGMKASTVLTGRTVAGTGREVYEASKGTTLGFQSTATGDITTTEWRIRRRKVSSAKSFTHKFDSAGDYTVTLTVSGPGGEPSTASKTVSIK